MTDLPSSLGIEAVECVAEGGPTLTVRVLGRWRRRRPEVRGQAMLVVETEGGRQRFLAMPEPPSLTGAAPGTWRMSFSVPAALAPVLPGHTFLQLGGVMVPLPIGEVTIATAAGEEMDNEAPSPGVLEARRARASDLAAESARRRAAELAAEVERLEGDLHRARDQSDRLREEITERERRVRGAEQDAYAERSLRADLEQEMASRTRRAQHDLSALHDRVAELERELIRLRRGVDEAGHLAATAEAARASADVARVEADAARAEADAARVEADAARVAAEQRLALVLAEHIPAEPAAPAADHARAEMSRRELELDGAAHRMAPPAASSRPPERAVDRILLGTETGMIRSRGRQRSDARVAELERQLALAREEAEAQRRRCARAYDAIDLVRGELRELRASRALASAGPEAGSGAVTPAGPVQPERLSNALARLRERTPPMPEEAPEPAPASEAPGQPEPEPPPEPAATAPPEPTAPEPSAPEPAVPEPAATAPPEPTTPDPTIPEPTAPEAPADERAAKPWLGDVFRALARQDPPAAGRLLLALLPAQRLADPHPVAYDLVLSDVLRVHVTVTSMATHVARDATIRPPSEVDFAVVGDFAGVARLLAAGTLRRRLRWLPSRHPMARIRGERRRIAALDRLVDARLTLRELCAGGVELDAVLALTVAALMIEPGWTTGERFTIGHREAAEPSPGAYLQVRDGRPALATAEPPHGPVSTVLVCPAGELLSALAGSVAGAIEGDEPPLSLLAQWLDRAVCG